MRPRSVEVVTNSTENYSIHFRGFYSAPVRLNFVEALTDGPSVYPLILNRVSQNGFREGEGPHQAYF